MVKYRTMVALGSSFAAGPGITPLASRAAGRSTRNYAHLVSRVLGAQLIDATVSGATTTTILNQAHWAGGRRFPPQILSVPEHADLITITAGGNEFGYLVTVMRTAGMNWLAARPLTQALGLRMRESLPLTSPTK
jgi:lysophospholipase L1-like esterase